MWRLLCDTLEGGLNAGLTIIGVVFFSEVTRSKPGPRGCEVN